VPRTVTDPEQLKAAAGSFGLLGIVTHVTLRLDKMRYAVMCPSKPSIGLAIPPLKVSDVPPALQKTWTADQLSAAQKDFEDKATNAFYSEWFWFTYQKSAWVNCWDVVEDGAGAQEYPSTFETWLQWIEGWIGGVITGSRFFNSLPGRWQAQLLATMGMIALPPHIFSGAKTEIKTQLPNGLHFRRGVSWLPKP
jgi:hypothetical protein